MGLAEEVLNGNRRSLARLATHVENDDDVGRAGLAKLYPRSGRAHVVGVTGPPGAGKSTLINALIGELRSRERTVGVVAVDPTSTVSGGAVLGDRIRMLDRQADVGVFIRSMASRPRTGGLAPATAGVVHLLDAAGFDVVLVETVGVGQEEVDVSQLVDTLVLVQVPASGDGVQLLKAGLLELADIYVVNKSDLPGTDELLRGLRSLLGFAAPGDRDWVQPVLRCSATKGEGFGKLADSLADHRDYLLDKGRLECRRRTVARSEVAYSINAEVQKRLGLTPTGIEDALIDAVAERRLTPTAAAQQLLKRWSQPD